MDVVVEDLDVACPALESGKNVLILKTEREAYLCAVTPDGNTLIVADGESLNDIKLYPIDRAMSHADSRQLLEQAQEEACMKLVGFALGPAR